MADRFINNLMMSSLERRKERYSQVFQTPGNGGGGGDRNYPEWYYEQWEEWDRAILALQALHERHVAAVNQHEQK